MAGRRTRPGDRGRKGIFRTALGKSLSFDSLWEKRRMQTLDLNGIQFSREGVGIPYIHEGKKRTYYPDLIIYDHWGKVVRYEEIKPSIRNNDIQNIAKWEAAYKYCAERGIEFRIINEQNLSKL